MENFFILYTKFILASGCFEQPGVGIFTIFSVDGSEKKSGLVSLRAFANSAGLWQSVLRGCKAIKLLAVMP
jgi:hypothetical protein